MKRTIVYVDGFNLYYGCLKGTPYRWLNPVTLAGLILSDQNKIVALKYYTARVNARPGNSDQPVRQDTYLRALKTLPEVSIYFGHYLSHAVKLPVANPRLFGRRVVEVIRAEEKGSDVNLATHIVADAFRDRFDTAVVISNDSDLCEPVRLVTQELRKPVGVVFPLREGRKRSTRLSKVATFIRPIREGALKASQFPDELTDAVGTFQKPSVW